MTSPSSDEKREDEDKDRMGGEEKGSFCIGILC
jgi:hypothetical protein